MAIEWAEGLSQAFISEIPNYIGTIALLGLGWLVGMRITHHWNMKRTQHELDLNASKSFEGLYGEFFAIWKLWNYYRRDIGEENFPKDLWFMVMDRAATSEGKLESLLVGIVSDRKLSDDDIKTLGMFRQGYQQLRESIRDDKPLEWNSSTDPEYVEFKALSPKVKSIIVKDEYPGRVSANEAAEQLKRITSNKWELQWSDIKK